MDEHHLARVFRALGNPSRIEILRLLSESPRWAYGLSETLSMTPRMVSKHLRALEDAGLITSETVQNEIGPDRKYFQPLDSLLLSVTFMSGLFDIDMSCPGNIDHSMRQDVEQILDDIKGHMDSLREMEQKRNEHICIINSLIREMNELMVYRDIPLLIRNRINGIIRSSLRRDDIDDIKDEIQSLIDTSL